MFKYIDLFAGMGGIRLGLEQALKDKGIKGECVLTSEIKPHALKVYKDNFGEDNIVGDITKIEGKIHQDIKKVNIWFLKSKTDDRQNQSNML